MDKKKKHERSELDKQLEKEHKNSIFKFTIASLIYYIVAGAIIYAIVWAIEFLLEFA